MRSILPASAAAAAMLLLSVSGANAQPDKPRFVRIFAPPPDPEAGGFADGISPDGAWVVGTIRRDTTGRIWEAFRWSEGTGSQFLGRLPPFPPNPSSSYAEAASLNGEVVAGSSVTCNWVAFMWRDGKMSELPRSLDMPCYGGAPGLTPDGRTAVGYTLLDASGDGAVIWRDGVPKRLVSDLPGWGSGLARALTPDAKTILVTARDTTRARYQAGILRDQRRLYPLPDLPGDGHNSLASGVSADGRLVAGSSFSEAFLWSEPTGTVSLVAAVPPGAVRISSFWRVSADGRVVTGWATRPPSQSTAVVWTAHTGTRYLADILREAGVDLQGIYISETVAMSADGRKYACLTRLPSETVVRMHYAVIPPFCFADCDNSGDLDFNDLLCFLNRFERASADPRANPIDFFYCDFAADDAIDFNDFLAFLNLYNQGCPK